jgi:drug/metabolite transporter (DMT)-like permease
MRTWARTRRGAAAGVGVAVAVVVTAVAFAGADKPPPRGFLWVVGGAVVMAAMSVVLIPAAMARWDAHGAARALGEAAVFGAGAGALVGVSVGVFASGEPSAPPSSASRALGLVVAVCVGAVLCAGMASIARLGDPRPDRHDG